MPARSRRASYLLALNWSLRLDWGSWLSDFAALPSLGQIPAGSVWILWLIISLLVTLTYLSSTRSSEPAVITPIEPEIEKPLIPNPELMDSRPDLKEKILRLHQSLDKI
jgi:hypothetical protein